MTAPKWMNDPRHPRWDQAITQKQCQYIWALEEQLGLRLTDLTEYTKRDASHRIEMLKTAIEIQQTADVFDALERHDGLDNC